MPYKKLLISILALAGSLSFCLADTAQIQKLSASPNHIKFRLESPALEISSRSFAEHQFHELALAGASLSANTGGPGLPIFGSSVILPPTGSYSLNVSHSQPELYPDINPYPVQNKEGLTDQYSPVAYREYQSQDLVLSSDIQIFRDFRVLQLSINPVSWDPLTHELKHYRQLDVEISFNDAPAANELPAYSSYSPAFRELYEANLINFDDYRHLNSDEDPGRILLIHWNNSTTQFVNLLDEYIAWKRQKGHDVLEASTQVTGTSSSQIKNYIQSKYDNPATRPDFVILVGDTGQIPTFTESFSGYGGVGDYPYTHLAGNDTLGDVMIGRISVENITHMAVIMKKIYRYERDLALEGPQADALNRLLLIGDPGTSGISCVYISKYIRDIALQANPDYNLVENYTGGYATTMNSGINQGVSFFNYRGWLGMSNWSPGSQLMNANRYPHAVMLTCSTGNFGSTATSETFIRLGTEANPTGAVTAIGMATTGTHTMFNNALSGGMFNGIFTYGMRNMGAALLNGRLFLQETYGNSHSSSANASAHWCNLMGDPSMEAFVGIPSKIILSAADTLSFGTNFIDVNLSDDSGNPLSNIVVTAYSPSLKIAIAKVYSNAQGQARLDISGGMTENIIITASAHDYKPSQKTVNIGSGAPIAFGTDLYDDGTYGSEGNGDGIAKAGEKIALKLKIRNSSTQNTYSGLTGTISSNDTKVEILSNEVSFESLSPQQEIISNEAVLIQISHGVQPNHDLKLSLNLTDDGGNTYQLIYHVLIHNAFMEIETLNLSAGGDDVLDPTETGSLQIGLKNTALVLAENIQLELISLNDLVMVEQAHSTVGDIMPNSLGFSTQSFELFARSLLIPGMQIAFKLKIYNAAGFEQFESFHLNIGQVSQNTPLGPDSYGYFIYDETDTAFQDCPVYEWIEINPSLGGAGTKLTQLNDSGSSGDEGETNGSTAIQILSLPFTFRFYGIDYDEISVCSNGFIALGETGNAEFRNCRLPGGLGPAPMIAPFWDDLIIISDGGVYQYYDEINHQFIIEYYKMRNGYNRTSLETFQVILYDPVYHPTSIGDGKIKFQYQDFNNVDVGGSGYTPRHGKYASIGIKDHTNTRGLEYSYNNQYPPAAAPLGANKALMINTVPVLHQSPYLILQDVLINTPNGNNQLEPADIAEIGIRLINQGLDEAHEVEVELEILNPYAYSLEAHSDYPNIASDAGEINSFPFLIQVSEDCPSGTVLSMIAHVSCLTGSWSYPFNLQVQKPAVYIEKYYVNDSMGNANGLAEPGETVDLVVNFANDSLLDAKQISVSLFCLSDFVEIPVPDAFLPQVKAGQNTQVVFRMNISENATVGNNLTFYITYLGEQIGAQNEQLLISLGTIGMSEDFETTNGNFNPVPDFNGWQWGVSHYAGAQSGSKIWGTRLNENYPANATYTLTTPYVYVGPNFMLEFWHRYETENNYDGGCVQVSRDGNSWMMLTPEGGYPHSNVSALNSAGFSGQSAGWVLARMPLTNFVNEVVRFRFKFASDSSINGPGWFIDDVRTTGYIQFAGVLSGQIYSSNPLINFSEMNVYSDDGHHCFPNDSGFYQLYLPPGNYLVNTEADGYYHLDPINVIITADNLNLEQDFYLGYLPEIEALNWNLTNDLLSLNWNPPTESEYDVLGYEIHCRKGGGLFELIDFTEDTAYLEHLPKPGLYQYYIRAKYPEGLSRPSDTIEAEWSGTAQEEEVQTPFITALGANYPNPFNPSTTIAYSLAQNEHINITIYNLRGQKVKTLVKETQPAGKHSVSWHGIDEQGRPVSSGLYLIRLNTSSKSFSRKAILMK